MTATADLILYLVTEGNVTPATAATEFDGAESLLVAATSAAGALEVARAFDAGEIAVDNLTINGETVACAWIKSRDGDYL